VAISTVVEAGHFGKPQIKTHPFSKIIVANFLEKFFAFMAKSRA